MVAWVVILGVLAIAFVYFYLRACGLRFHRHKHSQFYGNDVEVAKIFKECFTTCQLHISKKDNTWLEEISKDEFIRVE